MMFFATTSRGCPCFSYIAMRKQGSMTTIITNADTLLPALSFSKKKSGKPTIRATAKQMICRFVRLKATFVLIFDKSFGTGTYAIPKTSSYYKVVVIRVPLQGQNATIDKVLWIGLNLLPQDGFGKAPTTALCF
jgi:hypothetical protein